MLVEVNGSPAKLHQRGALAGEALAGIAPPDESTHKRLAALTRESLSNVAVEVWLLEDMV